SLWAAASAALSGAAAGRLSALCGAAGVPKSARCADLAQAARCGERGRRRRWRASDANLFPPRKRDAFDAAAAVVTGAASLLGARGHLRSAARAAARTVLHAAAAYPRHAAQ